jgi:hypothetical protein
LTIFVKIIKIQLLINQFYDKVFNMQWWVGKIALFSKALVLALARGALPMCAMWVGVSFFFFVGGKKKQNKFHQLALTFQKAKCFLFFNLSLSYLAGRLFFLHLLPTDSGMKRWGFRSHFTTSCKNFNARQNAKITT